MNEKTAKLLRAIVRKNVADNRQKANPVAHAYVEIEKHRKYMDVPDGEGTKRVAVATGQLMVAPGTIRGMYRQLKKAYKRGSLNFETLKRARNVF